MKGHVYAFDTIRTQGQKRICFYDSYGRFTRLKHRELTKTILDYSRKQQVPLDVNLFRHQLWERAICSHLSIFVLLQRARGYTLKDIQQKKLNNLNFLKLIPFLVEQRLPLHIRMKREGKVLL